MIIGMCVLVINAKGKPFPTEPLLMGLLLARHKMVVGYRNKQNPIKRGPQEEQTTYLVAAVELILRHPCGL
jgi:hypothetical protein